MNKILNYACTCFHSYIRAYACSQILYQFSGWSWVCLCYTLASCMLPMYPTEMTKRQLTAVGKHRYCCRRIVWYTFVLRIHLKYRFCIWLWCWLSKVGYVIPNSSISSFVLIQTLLEILGKWILPYSSIVMMHLSCFIVSRSYRLLNGLTNETLHQFYLLGQILNVITYLLGCNLRIDLSAPYACMPHQFG